MNYFRAYENLINTRKNVTRNKKEEYFESHHIIPKSMGGSDDDENLILLTGREHFVAHLLLSRIYPNNVGMKSAVFLLIANISGKRKTGREYDIAKKMLSKRMSEQMKGYGNPFYGKNHTEKTRSKMKASRAQLLLTGSHNSNFGNRWTWEEKGYDKEKLKNRKKADLSKPEVRKKLSDRKIGENNPMAKTWIIQNIHTGNIVEITGGLKRKLSQYDGSAYHKLLGNVDPNWKLLRDPNPKRKRYEKKLLK